MRILFSNPPNWVKKNDDGLWTAFVRAGSRWPFSLTTRSSPDNFIPGDYIPAPLFMQYAASYAKKMLPNATVMFRDSIALRESYETFWNFINEGDFNYVVMECSSPCWEHDAKLIEKLANQANIIVTGPIVAARGQEIVDSYSVCAAIKGEYEKGVVKVVNGASGLIDFDFLSEKEMNEAPPPYMTHNYITRYYDNNPKGQKHPQAQIWTSRGCWAKCAFCSFPSVMTSNDPDGTKKRTVRHYHKDSLAYLSIWRDNYGIKSVWLDDDLFNTSDKHVLEMCEVFKELGLPWSAMCRADGIKKSTWQAMKDSGCTGCKIGVESASQRVLDEIVNKRLDLNEAIETLRWLREIGLNVHTTFMVGHPGETIEEQKQTLEMIARFYREGLHQTHQLSGTAVLDGTPLAQIGTGKLLAKYPGAKVDENYHAESDGNAKLKTMIEQLK
jgi:radical SAM superfamily enzyme YgiQ (UPF0313 family)